MANYKKKSPKTTRNQKINHCPTSTGPTAPLETGYRNVEQVKVFIDPPPPSSVRNIQGYCARAFVLTTSRRGSSSTDSRSRAWPINNTKCFYACPTFLCSGARSARFPPGETAHAPPTSGHSLGS